MELLHTVVSLTTAMSFFSPTLVPLFLALLPASVGAVEASDHLRRNAPSDNEQALSSSVIVSIIIGSALFASCILALYLYKRYNPSNPSLPLYTMPARRYRVLGGIRIRLADNYRARRPAQGASPMAWLPSLNRAPTSEGGAPLVSFRSVPMAHTHKTKVALPAAGAPAIATTILNAV